ncbi:MAG: hypothetical protein EXX96DRAFT_576293 [Benjaminiella poitrasii]|nr:MAG: hypothetical protein EXX96DRAFT_576293 [Benjaminiella poitrasii]
MFLQASMEATPIKFTTSDNNNSIPKRIRSVSARIFSLNHHSEQTTNKRLSYQSSDNSSNNSLLIHPSKWFPKRRRCRSSSSSSSTFSVIFSTPSAIDHYLSSTAAVMPYPPIMSLENVSSELEELYKNAKEEIDYAIESQESIYYEGDRMTAFAAVELCEQKYNTVMQVFGDSTYAIKFGFRWEIDLHQLRLQLSLLPEVTHSIYK